MRFVVIDTNVVVRGVLRGSRQSPNRRIVEAMLGGGLRFLLSEVLLAEYRGVLLRSGIAERHGLTESEIDCLLTGLVVNATMRDPSATLSGRSTIHGDEHLIALLRAVPESVLITGDKRLADAVGTWCDVMTPAEFATSLP